MILRGLIKMIGCKGMEAQGPVYTDVNWVKAGGAVGD